MGIERKICAAGTDHAVATIASRYHDRDQDIRDMTAALVDMFGPSAYAIARSQPSHRDAGGNSGIWWHELSEALRPTQE